MKTTIFFNMDVDKTVQKFDSYYAFLRWAVWYRKLKQGKL